MTVGNDHVLARSPGLLSVHKGRVQDIAVLALDLVILLIVFIEVQPKAALFVDLYLPFGRNELGLDERLRILIGKYDQPDQSNDYYC